MSVHKNMRRIVLQTGFILLLNVFSLTGCSQEKDSNMEVHHEAETRIEDDWKQQETVLNMSSIELYPDGTISVEIRNQKQYAAWIRQLENYTDSPAVFSQGRQHTQDWGSGTICSHCGEIVK